MSTISTTVLGDCIEVMRRLPDASVDAVVTDPPYELGFMNKGWDASGIAFNVDLWREALRVLKPGGYILAFGGTRTYHRMTVAIEDAGFEIRDCIGWHYGSGFPKSLDVSKAIDKSAGAEREVIGVSARHGGGTNHVYGVGMGDHKVPDLTAPATDDAKAWAGWGTALKPAWEPVVVARKPLEGTVAANVLKYGTGAMNIDASRVPTSDRLGGGHSSSGQQMSDGWHRPWMDDPEAVEANAARSRAAVEKAEALGRWPANILLSHGPDCSDEGCASGCPCAALDAQSGGDGASRYFNRLPIEEDDLVPFFYTPKASRSEREAGCDALGSKPPPALELKVSMKSPRAGAGRTAESIRNNHPTVKPVSIMEWCIKLVAREGAVVLDPFMGSGTTGVAAVRCKVNFVGIELSPEYIEIARARIGHARGDR
jgi:site-specific DNA-methyltransferase (adenine-specific)